MVSNSCMICSHPVSETWLDGCKDFYLRASSVVNYKKCANCNLVQQVPLPSNTLEFYRDYPMHASRSKIYELARKLMHRHVYFMPPKAALSSSLLDFGCGDGSYLQSVRDHTRHCLGFEPDATLAYKVSNKTGAPVYSNLNELAAKCSASVDYVTAHFVLEHLTDLRAAFKCFSVILKPGGMIHIALPNIRSWEARLFRRFWHGLDAPRHISFPDETSLGLLSEQYSLKLLDARSAFFPNTLAASMATILTGCYRHSIFLSMIPLGLFGACLAPSGTRVFRIRKNG